MSFNAVGLPPQPNGDPTCNRVDNSGKSVAFGDFIASVGADGSDPGWSFDRSKTTIDQGDTLVGRLDSRAGEFHSFTEVPQFGPGCVDLINELIFGPGTQPNARCGEVNGQGVPVIIATGLLRNPGGSPAEIRLTGLSRGVHRFECLIHPWMQTTVTVR